MILADSDQHLALTTGKLCTWLLHHDEQMKEEWSEAFIMVSTVHRPSSIIKHADGLAFQGMVPESKGLQSLVLHKGLSQSRDT